MTIKVDLHPVFRNDREIDRAIRKAVFKATAIGEDVVEIIPGKGAGKLRDRVLAMLKRGPLHKLCRDVVVDPGNEGRILVHLARR